jgi:hypothetical protein
MRKITGICANNDWTLDVSFDDGAKRRFDVKPLLEFEAFASLSQLHVFKSVRNGGYFVEWASEADLSADTLYLDGIPVGNGKDTEHDRPTSKSTATAPSGAG